MADDLRFLMTRFILDHIFGPKKDKLFCTVFVFRRDMPNVISDLALYLQSEGLNTSLIYPRTIPLRYLKTVFAFALFLFLLSVFCSFSFFICWWILTSHYFITLFRGVIILWPSHCNSICL